MFVCSYSQVQEFIEKDISAINSKRSFQSQAKKTPKSKKYEILNLLCNAIKGDVNVLNSVQNDTAARLYSIQESKVEVLCDCDGLPLVYFNEVPIKKTKWVIPSLHLLWKWGLQIPCFEVASPVSTFILKGANLMLPGVNMKYSEECINMLTKGMVVGIKVIGDRYPFAIGLARTNKATIRCVGCTGQAMSTLFTFKDVLGNWHKKIDLPIDAGSELSRFTCARVLPVVMPTIEIRLPDTSIKCIDEQSELNVSDDETKPISDSMSDNNSLTTDEGDPEKAYDVNIIDEALEFLLIESILFNKQWFKPKEPPVTLSKVLSEMHSVHSRVVDCDRNSLKTLISNDESVDYLLSNNKISFAPSSYKNIVDFANKMSNRGYFSIKKRGKTADDIYISQLNNHDIFDRQVLVKVKTNTNDKEARDEYIRVISVYIPTGAAKSILVDHGIPCDHKKNQYVNPSTVVPALMGYVKKNNYIKNKNDVPYVYVDDKIADIIFDEKQQRKIFKQLESDDRHMPLKDVASKFKSKSLVPRCQIWKKDELIGTISKPPEKLVANKISRRGHKITIISGFNTYMLPTVDVAKFLSNALASSCWAEGDTSVAVQGWKINLDKINKQISKKFGIEMKT